jgi:hypothetical protein
MPALIASTLPTQSQQRHSSHHKRDNAMRARSLFLTLCLCLLAALAVTPAIAQEPAPKATELKGTAVKIPQQTLSFSGHIQKLNAQLPIPWFGLKISQSVTPLSWSFDGTYWGGVIDICQKYQCAINFFDSPVQFETDGDFASFIHQGPFLFVVAETTFNTGFFMFVEPHMSIVDVNIKKMTAGGKEFAFKKDTYTAKGTHGNIGLNWKIEASRDMIGPLVVELEADIASSTTTLIIDAVQGATASADGFSVSVTEMTNDSISLLWDGGAMLSIYPTNPLLERLASSSWSSGRSYSQTYKIDHWEPGAQFVVTFAKEIQTQKFSLEFKDIDFKALVPEK